MEKKAVRKVQTDEDVNVTRENLKVITKLLQCERFNPSKV